MPLTESRRAFLVVLAARIVPWSADLEPARREAMLALIDRTLASRPAAMQRQFGLFLTVLRWAPALRYLAVFDRLSPARQDAVLQWFQYCPVAIIRSGFWGVRTLIFLGCYGQPETAAAIGYTPTFDGNAVLHARARR